MTEASLQVPRYLGQGPAVMVPIDSLSRADSPRFAGESEEHAGVLAQSGAVLPPILVHRTTMRVIDGMHRLRAAALRGQEQVEVVFFDGDDKDAFVLAVEMNIAHGLPLSLAERTAAAARIMRSHPRWSDRMIASATGLAPKTVGAIRRRSTEHGVRANTRVGRDGRVRPVNGAAGRRLAGDLLAERPDASLREIARAAGIAPSTVLDVRERLRTGRDPVPPKQRDAERRPAQGMDRAAMLRSLRRDPSLRFTEAGRAVLRWLDTAPTGTVEWAGLADQIPPHCMRIIAELAGQAGNEWHEFARHLRRRARTTD